MKEFGSLIDAIVADDRVRAMELLKKNPSLARQTLEGEARYEMSITHWIYVGDTALHTAAAGYRVEIAKMLMSAGANSNIVGKHRGGRPIHYASDGHFDSEAWNPKRQVRMIELLLKAGADIQAQDKNGAASLHRAVRTRCAAAVRCLLEAGADAALQNKPGSTPFHLAVQNTGRGGSGSEEAKAAQCEIIQAFLDHGVSPSLKDGRGKSVLDWAKGSDVILTLRGSDAT